MSLVCALSGVAPEDAVFAPTGYIFERRLIEKHLKSNGNKCPITGEELLVDSLQSVKTSKIAKPRPVSATSIPGLLSLFQSEWDATMAETFALRQHVEQVRSQLSQTLYQHDASCRVIARLLRERNAAQSRLVQLQKRLADAESEGGLGGVEAEPGLSEEDLKRVVQLAEELPNERKRRNKNPPYAPARLASMACDSSFPLHSTTTPGVTCCAVDNKAGSSLLASGGADAVVALFDMKEKKSRARLAGHMKRVNRVAIHPSENVILSASDDKTTRVWRLTPSDDDQETMEHTCAHINRRHAGAVTDIALHPLGSFYATCAKDHAFALHDISSGKTLSSQMDLPHNYRCVAFHPDGALLSAGDDGGNFEIWDMKEKKPSHRMVSLSEHSSGINRIAFSENGTHATTASEDGTLRIWDLRKATVFQTIKPPVDDASEGKGLTALAYDKSANFLLAACGSKIIAYNIPQKAEATQIGLLKDHTSTVTDLCFGPGAEFVISSSMDRLVKVWRPSSESQTDDIEMAKH